MNQKVALVSLLCFFTFFNFASEALGFSEIGKFNDNFSYRYLKQENSYLSGEITNISSYLQRDVTIDVDGFDFLNRQLWSTTIHIDLLSPNCSTKFNNYIGQYDKRTAELKFKVSGDTSGPNEERNNLAHTSAYGCFVEISGVGPQMSDFFVLRKGVNKFTYEYDGKHYFGVKLYRDSGNYKDLVASEIGGIKGSKGVSINDKGQYYLNVEADKDGKWFIKVELPLKSMVGSEEENIFYMPQSKIKEKKIPCPEKTVNDKFKIWTDEKGVIHIEENR